MHSRQLALGIGTGLFLTGAWFVAGALAEQEPPALGDTVVVVRDADPLPTPDDRGGADPVRPRHGLTSAPATTVPATTQAPVPTTTAAPQETPVAPPVAPPPPPADPDDDDPDDPGDDDDGDDDDDDDGDDPDDDGPGDDD